MNIKSALKEVVIANGGTPASKTIPGLIKELVTIKGGTSAAKTISSAIHDLAVAENPLIKLTITPCDDTATLMGESDKASDLQTGVAVEGNTVTGYLKYVTGYNDYSTSSELNHGNFIALHAEVPGVEGVTISVTMSRTVDLESDGNVVARVADKDTQTLTFTAAKQGYTSVSKVLSLKALRLEAAPEVVA